LRLGFAYADRRTLSRRGLVRLGAAGGAALLVPSSRALAASSADEPRPDADLANFRLLIGAELLAIDFRARALAAGKLRGCAVATYRRSLADDRVHYATLAKLVRGAGEAPATAADVDFRYPRGSFGTARTISTLGWRIETLLLGAYLGAVETMQTPALRLAVGQIAANEAQHLSALAPFAGKPTIGRPFPSALAADAVSTALDVFES
jgi:Ferritin-like domain